MKSKVRFRSVKEMEAKLVLRILERKPYIGEIAQHDLEISLRRNLRPPVVLNEAKTMPTLARPRSRPTRGVHRPRTIK